jgi:restriction system protein
MRKRKGSGFDLLTSMRWPVPVVIGIVGYMSIRYGIGWLFGSSQNIYLAGLSRQLSSEASAPVAWLVLGVCWLAALASYIGAKGRRRLLEKQRDLDSLSALGWRQFELLVGEAFRRQGYTVEETGQGGADGGIDLMLRRHGKLTLVQCKRWKTQRVDVKVVREMYGLLAHHGASEVKIVAIGSYTTDAQRFATGKPIELITGTALLNLVRSVQTASAQSTPHARASTAPETTPTCPKCGKDMQLRANRRTDERFWGCASYPSCRGTRPLAEKVL